MVALTFDEGGRAPGTTASLLDTLRKNDVKSTFFLTGEWTESNPSLVKRMRAEGHELANHTFDHPYLTKIGDAAIVSELDRAEKAIQATTGVGMRHYIRPPFGNYDQRVLDAVNGHGYEMIYWSLDSGDWRTEISVADMIDIVSTKAKPGDIIVAHCYSPKTAEAYPEIVAALKSRGLKLGTVSQVLGR